MAHGLKKLITATVFATLACTAVQATAVTNPQTKRNTEIIGGATGGALAAVGAARIAASLTTQPATATRLSPPPETSSLKTGEGIGDIAGKPLNPTDIPNPNEVFTQPTLDPAEDPVTASNTVSNAGLNLSSDTAANDIGVGANNNTFTNQILVNDRNARRVPAARDELTGEAGGAESLEAPGLEGVRFNPVVTIRRDPGEYDPPATSKPYPSQTQSASSRRANALEQAEEEANQDMQADDAAIDNAESGSNATADAIDQGSEVTNTAVEAANTAANNADGGVGDLAGDTGGAGDVGGGDLDDLGDLVDLGE